QVRRLLEFLPSNNMESPPAQPNGDPKDRADVELATIVPENPNQPYNMLDVLHRVVDNADFMQVHEEFARNMIVGFA
ncbi:MAG TPA: methylmalonyl-CoA carboxyltransferase, partial [Dehalococcoidia bacterium]|nr:methylmalonyl-CoA carboxyltransferase [Dehalococcoidia bacterium]